MIDYLVAALLGIIEGLTEFLPVSSTGHQILAERLIGRPVPEPFIVMIQLGAIMALVVVYFRKIMSVVLGLPTSPQARRFTYALLLAFFPAVVLGVVFHDFIKTVLFSPVTVSIALVIGGVIMLLAERYRPAPVVHDVDDLPLSKALFIGLAQCVALIPGVSRSGATIVGAMMLGVDRRAAAEFSFFLSMPTMLGAFAYDFWKTKDALAPNDYGLIATGLVFAFVSALLIVKPFLDYVGRAGFAPFAWYRIVLGTAMLAIFWPR